jgi:outer membrane lipoprotein SlyB
MATMSTSATVNAAGPDPDAAADPAPETGRGIVAGSAAGAILGTLVGGPAGGVVAAMVGSALGGVAGRVVHEQRQDTVVVLRRTTPAAS